MRGVASMNALAIGFQALLRVQGEPVTFRDKSVRALVNRTGNQFNASSRIPTEAKVPTGTIVWFPYPDVKDEPIPGETFTGLPNKTFNIESTTFLGHAWECVCGIS
jgi:hypothetical protein